MDVTKRLATEKEGAQEVSTRNPEPRHFGELLPKEIWELIAKMVLKASAEDYLNLVNSSSFFQHLMASQRTTALFEQVLPLVALSVWKKEDLEGFSVSEVLKCRLVCKDWNAAIQKVVPDQFNCSSEPFIAKELYSWVSDWEVGLAFEEIQKNDFLTDVWDDEEDSEEEEDSAHKFLRHFEKTHPTTYQPKERNPFFCREIRLAIENYLTPTAPGFQRYLQGVTSLLTKYGTQVDIFVVEIDHVGGDQFLSLMPKWLSLLPNLKEFEFCNWLREYLRQMELDVNANPLPESKCLEKIKIHCRPQPILKYLIKQSRQTVCELFVENPEEYEDLFTLHFPNLKKLTLKDYERDIAQLLSSPHVHWPLETLVLFNVKFVGGYAQLFQVIQDKFAETLVCFKLEIKTLDDDVEDSLWEDCQNSRLDLPKLKNIQLDFGDRPLCLEFLLPMRNNLEEIAGSCGKERYRTSEQFSSTSEQVIQYTGLEKRLLESNIWVVFTKLNEFHLQTHGVRSWSYSRKEWMLNKESSGSPKNDEN